MIKAIVDFFDKLEDRVRIRLSRYPIFFAFLAGFAIVEFWRGVWHMTDNFTAYLGLDPLGWESSLASIVVSRVILLMTGIYVALFLTGDGIIMEGKKGQTKKMFERTEEEIKQEKKELLREGLKIQKLEEKIDLLTEEITQLKDVLAKK